jgi:hypothetical protein
MVRTRFNHGWSRRGFTLLWDAETLAEIVDPAEVVSIRQMFAMVDRWPDELPAAGGDAVVVAGVEGCLDVLSGPEAERWLVEDLRRAIMSFQTHYEGGAGLVFWLPSGRSRIVMRGASEEYHYKHRNSGDSGLHIGRLLWSGAENEIERIMNTDDDAADYDGKHWVGLYHPRIS